MAAQAVNRHSTSEGDDAAGNTVIASVWAFGLSKEARVKWVGIVETKE
jgi:hypothetical protein